MPAPVYQGISANTPNRLLFDAGAMYRDYGETGEELISATRGGATFTVERDDREIEVDGTKGPVKGLRRTIRAAAMLEATLLEMSLQTFLDLTRGTAVSDGTHYTVTPDIAIVSGDYYTNIALVAESSGSSDPLVLVLKNALTVGEWDITTDDADEGELGFSAAAHFDPGDLSAIPFEIKVPIAAS